LLHKSVDRLKTIVEPIDLLFHNPVLNFDVFDVLIEGGKIKSIYVTTRPVLSAE
jgi:hypothetical protein